jgi:hypothetical protein
MHVMLVLLMEGIYEVPSWDGLRWHDTHTKFHKDWFMHSNGVGDSNTCTQTARWSHKPTYIISNKGSSIKIERLSHRKHRVSVTKYQPVDYSKMIAVSFPPWESHEISNPLPLSASQRKVPCCTVAVTFSESTAILPLSHWLEIVRGLNCISSTYITFLDIIHRLVICLKCRPVYISKHNVSETGFCLRPQVSLSLRMPELDTGSG